MESNSQPAVLTDEEIQIKILSHLNSNPSIENTLDFASTFGISHSELDKSLKSLTADEYITLKVIEKKLLELSAEGKSYVEKGTPEY